MRITTALWVGAGLLALASFLDFGRLFFPLAIPAIVVVLKVRDRVPAMAKSPMDARISNLLLDALMGLLFVLSVGAWSLGPVLVMIGYAGNHVAILANGLAMPSTGSTGINPSYAPITERTRMRWLCDIFVSRRGADTIADFSIGDAFIAVGMWVFAAEIILARFVS